MPWQREAIHQLFDTLQFQVLGKGPVKQLSATVSVQVVAPSGCGAFGDPAWLALAGLAALGLRRRARA